MLTTLLTLLATSNLAGAVPVERATSTSLLPIFGGSQLTSSSTVQLGQLALAATYYLEPSTGSIPASNKYTTIIVKSTGNDDTTGTLIGAWSGQTSLHIPLTNLYLLGVPSKIYAPFTLPSIPSGSSATVCTFIYQQPSILKSVGTPSRNGFSAGAFASSLGLTNPVADFCVTVANGAVKSTAKASTTSVALITTTVVLPSVGSTTVVLPTTAATTPAATTPSTTPVLATTSSTTPVLATTTTVTTQTSPAQVSPTTTAAATTTTDSAQTTSVVTTDSTQTITTTSVATTALSTDSTQTVSTTSIPTTALSTDTTSPVATSPVTTSPVTTSPVTTQLTTDSTQSPVTTVISTDSTLTTATTVVTTTTAVTTTPAVTTASSTDSLTTTAAVTTSSTSFGVSGSLTAPQAAYQTAVTFQGKTYINKGLVAFGAISGDAKDSQGETIGGIGSAIALQSLTKNGNSYTGTVIVQPDRGHNTASTTDYVARRHFVDFTLNPYYDSTPLNYTPAKSTFDLTYQSSILYYEQDGTPTTGLNALAARGSVPPLPIASTSYNHIATDAEGLVFTPDGSSWVSDEYGPYIYQYSADGHLLQTIQPPFAVLPMLNGSLYFDAGSSTTPTTGRVQNQGFEGLTISPDGTTLYALLQSGLTQDLDSSGEGKYTRLFIYDITATPTLLSSYVLLLPVTSGKAKALAQSDVQYLSPTTFMVLSRDGKGGGNTDSNSKNKNFILYTTIGATDISQTTYTTGTTPVAPGGKLVSGITAMQPTNFINMIDETQLERFGLYNNGPFAVNLINGKWESAALTSCQDPAFPNDYFLFSFSDNDFISLNGFEAGTAYQDAYAVSNGYSLDNQALVWRVTLP